MKKIALVATVLLVCAGCTRQKEKQLVAEQAAISTTVSKRKADLTPAQKDQFIEATAQGWYNLYLLQGGKPRAQPVAPLVAPEARAVPARAKAETEKKYNGD